MEELLKCTGNGWRPQLQVVTISSNIGERCLEPKARVADAGIEEILLAFVMYFKICY